MKNGETLLTRPWRAVLGRDPLRAGAARERARGDAGGRVVERAPRAAAEAARVRAGAGVEAVAGPRRGGRVDQVGEGGPQALIGGEAVVVAALDLGLALGRGEREQVLVGDLVGVGQRRAVGVAGDLVVVELRAEAAGEVLRRVAVDEPVRVHRVAEQAQERALVDVALVLQLEDRDAVVVAVAQAVRGGGVERAAARALHELVRSDGVGVGRREQAPVVDVAVVPVGLVRRARGVAARVRGAPDAQRVADHVRPAQVVDRAVVVGEDLAGQVEELHVVARALAAVRDAPVQVDDVVALLRAGDPVGLGGREVQPVAGRGRLAGRDRRAVPDVEAAAAVAERVRDRVERLRVARAVAVVDVAVVLVRAGRAHVVREVAVLRRPAVLEREAVEERRRAQARVEVEEARIGAGPDHLVDVARETLAVRRRRRAAGIDLQLLLAQRREHGLRGVVVDAVDRDAVELVADLVDVAAADRERLVPALLALLHHRARHRLDRAVRVGQAARPAQAGRGVGRRAADRVDVAGGARLHQVARGARSGRADLGQAARQRAVEGLRLVRLDRDAGQRERLVAAPVDGDRVRVGRERQEAEPAAVVGRRALGLRGRDHRDARARHGRAATRIDDAPDDRPGGAGASRHGHER